jgi:predicted SAM-dependent methyltransferase
MIKINMGCGWRDFGTDWVHIDGGDYAHLDYESIEALEFEDNTIDLIYASHVIEYFDRYKVEELLGEWYRVLRPGAILRIAVPNFRALSALYVNGTVSLDRVLGPLYGRMPLGDLTIYHKTAYDFVSLKKVLESCGYSSVIKYDWRETEHATFDDHSQAYIPHMDKENGTLVSLNVECIKRNKKRSNKQ